MFFFFKRIIFVFILIHLRHSEDQQVLALIILHGMSLAYIGALKPFKDNLLNYISFFNELGVLSSSSLFFPYVGLSAPFNVYYLFAVLIITNFLILCLVNILIVLYQIVLKVVKRFTKDEDEFEYMNPNDTKGDNKGKVDGDGKKLKTVAKSQPG